MADEQQPPLKVLAFNCTLKSSKNKEQSSTDVLLNQMMDALSEHGATGAVVRAVDHNIKPGVRSDEGEGDDWPALRQRVINCDILVMGTPIWLGQPSSVAKRVMERMDAFLGETDDKGRMPSYGKVGIVVVVGNEDGAHHCEAQGDKVYKDLKTTPKVVKETTEMLASNAAHLARLLKLNTYPGVG
jgi:multimeric flavodoxin WrbA